MVFKNVAIIGSGGHGREVDAFLKKDGFRTKFFVSNPMNGYEERIENFDNKKYAAIVAVVDPKTRAKIVSELPNETEYLTFIHPTSILVGDIKIGPGSYIGPYSVLTTNIEIGNHAILNGYNRIGHDCMIGSFFSAMPGSIISGNVTIKSRVYLGTNSSIREGLTIESDVKIGLNSGVIKNISRAGVYGGTPAILIKV